MLTVKRLFKAKNTGLTPIYISGFEIEGQPCEAHGFKVLNCEPFTIEPSQSVDVDIAFTPDFTLSKVTRILTLQTSLSPEKRKLNFTLQATVPAHMLFVCASVLPRPSWEPYLFYIINTFMVFVLVCVLITAVMEAERILKVTVGIPLQARTHLLDLRRVAEEVDQDMRQRLSNGTSQDDDVKVQSSTPASRPVEKKLLLSRLASRSLNLMVMPFALSFGLVRKSLLFVKTSVFSFRSKKNEEVSQLEDLDDVDDEDLEDEEDDEDVGEEDGIEDGDDEGEEDAVFCAPVERSSEQKTSNVSSVASSSSLSSRQHRSRKRGRQNPQNWRQKANGELLAGSDDPCDSSSTCTESSVVEEDNPGNSSGSNNRKGNQRNKKNNRPSLTKENSNPQIITSEATNNANNNITNTNKPSNSLNNNNNNISKKEKPNKKLVTPQPQQQQPVKSPVPEDDQNSKPANPSSKPNPVEPINKKPVTAKAAKTTPTPQQPIPIAPQQQNQVAAAVKKTLVKQQAKVKPSEKPPRLALKSQSESEDRPEIVSTSPATPGLSTGNGSIFGTSSISPSAPLSETSKLKTKVTPVGKILPEIKKPENLGAQFGPIGAKPPAMMSNSGSARKSTWSDSPAEPRPPAMIGNGNSLNRIDSGLFRNSPVDPPSIPTPTDIDFGLRYQQQQQHQQLQQQQQQQQAFTAQQQQQRLLNIDDIGGGLGISSGLIESGGRICRAGASANNGSPTHSSLMQALQYERRQRTEEFFSQHQPDWPGFGPQLPTESYLENLWDTPPTDVTDPLTSGRSNLTSGWGSFSQIWPSTLWGTSVGFGPSSPASPPAPIEPLPTYNSRLSSLQQDQVTANEYNSLASVWGESPKRQPPSQQQQQQQQQQAYQQAQQQLPQGLNPSWSSTLFSNHHQQE